jgi:cellulose synthase/poly-beta-1,6-N-acetylglucosamine synthase-like glycosyltransferase
MAVFSTVVLLSFVAALKVGLRRLINLNDLPLEGPAHPLVSIVVAARNEEKDLEKALRSLLALDYKAKEIVVVNDRSTDKTKSILDRLQQEYSALQVLHIDHLPTGWLGKNHAHYAGAHTARGSVLLFTDADIVMSPDSLSRAVSYFEEKHLDHLAVLPRVLTRSSLLATVIVGFQFFFTAFVRPWKVKDRRSFAHVGIGAFNMIRKSAYEKIGTHRSIAMRPDDDMRLGRRIKQKGLRSDFLVGVDSLQVEWYDSVKGLIEGLMKNSFSATNYHLSLIFLGSFVLSFFFIWPFVGVVIFSGLARFFYVVTSVLILMGVALNAHRLKMNVWQTWGFPFTMLLLLYIVWKASLRTLWKGGIEWRGTFYSLRDLRSSSPRQ